MVTPEVRALTPEEVDVLLNWAAGEGWNPGLYDATPFRAVDPKGFLGAFVEGKLVSGISAVKYDAGFGFVGLYITSPDERGRGYGRSVWNAGIARLEGCTIGLDGVPAQQENYGNKGFAKAYGNVRYSGHYSGAIGMSGDCFPITSALYAKIIEYDGAYFPAIRSDFLTEWLGAAHRAFVCIEADQVAGYGVARKCRSGCKIGPLFAHSLEAASALLSSLALECEGHVVLDVPVYQKGFMALLEAGGLQPGFETARMYRGKAPVIDRDGVFAITSLELG